MEPPKATLEELIHNIEIKDKRFRIAQSIFFVMLIIALLALIIVQQRTLLTSQQTLTAVQSQVEQQQKDVQSINNNVNCIASYFTKTDRVNLRLDDVQNCQFTRSER